MTARTCLHDAHLAAGARMIDFHGWEMPVHYGSQLEEHHAVRRSAGLFDVSHMTVVDLDGSAVLAWLRYLLANDVARLQGPGRALYTTMLNPAGGVLDDLIVYRRQQGWRLVLNSATREQDLAWLQAQQTQEIRIQERPDLAMLAVQGPEALSLAASWLGSLQPQVESLPAFGFVEDDERFVARTGYTGEDGFEVILPASQAPSAWQELLAAGIQPAGLGARDTLRLEAGLNLHGQDMDTGVSPLESNLGWTVAWEPAERSFIGREALEKQRAEGIPTRLIAVRLEGKGVLRPGQTVLLDGTTAGALTSGAFSPTLGSGIGLARVTAAAAGAEQLEVAVRQRKLPVRRVKLPFVRRGQAR